MSSFQYKSCFYIGLTNIKYVRVFQLFICIDAFKKLNSQFNNKNLLDWITGQGGQLSMGKKFNSPPIYRYRELSYLTGYNFPR